MKIKCDVCDNDEASVFCVADEAALCSACDHRVHHANKLAGKHHRFSLHHPSPKQAPICDICREKRAFLFCQQDRAILCIDCNTSIHKANEHTQKHTRFLLTGVKLSSDSTPCSSELPSTSSKSTTPQSGGVQAQQPCDTISSPELINGSDLHDSVSGNSISEYLIDMLPGWHVEDLLDSSSYGLCNKSGENDLMPFWDGDLEQSNIGMWVPQVHPPLLQGQNQSVDLAFGAPIGMKEFSSSNNMIKYSGSSRKRSDDSSFLVPQINPSLNASKKSRTFW